MGNPIFMSQKVFLVVNPISGGTAKDAMIQQVHDFAQNRGYSVDVFETTGDDDFQKIQTKFGEVKPDRVLVAGGDGTVKMVGEALEKENVVLGIIPAGSANGLSVDLDFPKDMNEILNIAFGDELMHIDMVMINGHKSVHLADVGLNAELIKNYENGSIRGKLGYALQSINTLTDPPQPFKVRVEANGQIVTADAKMLVVANSNRYGTGVTINPMGKMDDGKFEIVIIKNLDLWVFGKIVVGNMPLDTGDVEIITAEKAVITTDVPVHFQVDGEYLGQITRMEAEILPKNLHIAVPSRV